MTLDVLILPSIWDEAFASIPSTSFTLSRSSFNWESSCAVSLACSLLTAVNVKERDLGWVRLLYPWKCINSLCQKLDSSNSGSSDPGIR